MIRFSIIIHVVKTKSRISYLFQSLKKQVYKNFEVILIEDCKGDSCELTFQRFKEDLSIKYYNKPESGDGYSINYAFNKASGDFFIVIDPDCFLPPDYLLVLEKHLQRTKADAFKGSVVAGKPGILAASSKMAEKLFHNISGKRKYFSTYSNSGFSRRVFNKTQGYILNGSGGNEEMFLRIENDGFKVTFPEDIFVLRIGNVHLQTFLKEFFKLGKSVVKLSNYSQYRLHFFHMFPLMLGLIILFLLILLFSANQVSVPGLLLLIPVVTVFIYATIRKKNPLVGFLTALLMFTQILVYTGGVIFAAMQSASR